MFIYFEIKESDLLTEKFSNYIKEAKDKFNFNDNRIESIKLDRLQLNSDIFGVKITVK